MLLTKQQKSAVFSIVEFTSKLVSSPIFLKSMTRFNKNAQILSKVKFQQHRRADEAGVREVHIWKRTEKEKGKRGKEKEKGLRNIHKD